MPGGSEPVRVTKGAAPRAPSPARRAVRVPVVDVTASLGDRMIAIALDTVVLLMVVGSLVLVGAYRWDLIPYDVSLISRVEVLATAAFAAVISFLYFWLFEGLSGATLGKSLVGIRVEGVEGWDLSLRESLVRTLLRAVDGLLFYFVGFVVAALSQRRQRIGDHVAGTVVVTDPPSKGWRAGALAIWLLLMVGPIYGVWRLVDPVRIWIEASVLQRTAPPPALEETPPPETTLALGAFAWLGSSEGPVLDDPTFRPGDRTWARYTVTGYGRNEGGGVNVLTETAAFDPSGAMIARPDVTPTLEYDESKPIERVDPLEIPIYAPGGTYELRIRVRDLSRARDATFVEPFQIDAPDVPPAEGLEIRNFVFSIAEDGFPLEAPVFDVGETVHYRFEVYGLTFVDDRIEARISYKLTAPTGRAIYATKNWRSIDESHRYHPASFFVPESGSISLPSDVAPGLYTIEHVVTDRRAGVSTTFAGQFRIR